MYAPSSQRCDFPHTNLVGRRMSTRLRLCAPLSMVHGSKTRAQFMGNERSANDADRRLGERIRVRRRELGMSQVRLGELLGVTFQQIQKYEKGVNRVAVSRLGDIALALEAPVSRFYEGLWPSRGMERSESSLEALLAKSGAVELVRLFAAIESDAVRRRVLELVRAVAADTA